MYALPQSELLEKDPALPKKGIRAKGGFNVTFVTVEIRATPGRPSFARGAISRLAQGISQRELARQHQRTFPRKLTFTWILDIRYKRLIYIWNGVAIGQTPDLESPRPPDTQGEVDAEARLSGKRVTARRLVSCCSSSGSGI
jgi:hypothetical protein